MTATSHLNALLARLSYETARLAKTRQNPAWICEPCGETHGNRKPMQATWHQGKCDQCHKIRPVTQPRDFGIINFHN